MGPHTLSGAIALNDPFARRLNQLVIWKYIMNSKFTTFYSAVSFILIYLFPYTSLAEQLAPPKFKMAKSHFPESVTLHKGVECSRSEDFSVLLDIYVPKAEGIYPAVLLIHGGDWRKRQVQYDKPLAERLAQRGYVVAQVAYRLSTDAKYPAAFDDCKTALRFMKARAADYKIDSLRFGCAGGSAGGHLSALLGMTSSQVETLPTIKACVVMATHMDLVALNREKNSLGHVLFLGSFRENQKLYSEASPIRYVSKMSPPTLFIEGEKDSYKVGRPEMQQKLRDAGVPTELVTLKDAPHPFWMSQPWLDQTAKAIGDWFDRYLKQHE